LDFGNGKVFSFFDEEFVVEATHELLGRETLFFHEAVERWSALDDLRRELFLGDFYARLFNELFV
jgi:hypothetical protein